MIKIKLNSIQRYYLTYCALFAAVLFSIYIMFFVQFKVINLQDQADEVNQAISAYEDEIKVLEVEWVYLTRPERLRFLTAKYLQEDSYIATNQVKQASKLEPYYAANLEKYENKDLAMGEINQQIAVR